MPDILFNTDNYVFSYRVAGICIRDRRVLLQKPTNDSAHAFPGGHVAFGETHADTLIREFKEETGADIIVGDLKWVEEVFFQWGDKPCQQICLYYGVSLTDEGQIPPDGSFLGFEWLEGRDYNIEFHWIPVEKLDMIQVYPVKAAELIRNGGAGVRHFVSRKD